MSLLRSVESTIASLVEGAFGRVFRSEVRPMELARKLAREMDAHRTVSVSRTYVPNEYSVWLSPEDRARFAGVEEDVIEELCAYLLEHARREELILSSHPVVVFETDERLRLGEFGIEARLVRTPDPPPHEGAAAGPRAAAAQAGAPAPSVPQLVEGERGETMIYSTSARLREGLIGDAGQPGRRPPRALLMVEGRRVLVAPAGATVGRSRECDVVLPDTGVSRRHAAIRPVGGGWVVEDLGSTNGVLLNGREVNGEHPLSPGDRLGLGSTEIVFELG
jgi:hypothetical protein